MAVQYPEAPAGRTAGSIHSVQIQAWKITNLSPNVTSDPVAHLFPPIAPTYASRSRLPSRQILKQLHTTTQRRNVHLIFVFRYSRTAAKDHDQDHVREALAMASHINGRGIVNAVNVSVVCGRNIKGCFVPSFANHMDTELEFAAQPIVAARRSVDSLRRLVGGASRAAELTLTIKAHIINVAKEGPCPVIVSMGTNAISHHWGHFSLLHQQLEAEYGPINIWLRLSSEEAFGAREEVNRVMFRATRNGYYWLLCLYGHCRS